MLGVILTLASSVGDIRSELGKLYNSTNGKQWTHNSGWLVQDDVCDWEGVVCNLEGNVTGLMLVNNNLNGSYDGDWLTFPHLEQLDLSRNAELSGDIGSHIRSLPPSLQTAFFHDCSFNSGIEFGDELCEKRTDTSKISVSGNKITSVECHVPSCVFSLDISQNPSAGGAPNITEATNLETLLLQGCNMTAPKGWLSTWCSAPLQEVNIADNQFLAGSVNDICLSKSLTALSISNTMLTGSLPTSVFELENLQVLTFSGNFDGILLDGFSNLKSLESLTLNGNFSGPLPGSIFTAPIKNVVVEHTQLSGTLPNDGWGDLKLDILVLDSNQLEGTIPSTLWTSVSTDIILSNNNFVGTVPVELESRTDPSDSLRSVQISNNKISGFVPDFYNDTSVQWIGDNETRKTFFGGLDLLSPVPQWVQEMGSNEGRLLTITDIDPKLVPSGGDSVVKMNGNLVWLPASTLHIGMCIVTNETTCDLPASPDYAVLPLTSVSEDMYEFTVPAKVAEKTGPFVMNIFYHPQDDMPAVINNHSATGITYNQFPVVSSVTPRHIRPEGCWAVTVTGSKFTDTLNDLKCKIGDNYTRATYVNTTSVLCHIPRHSTKPTLNVSHEIVVTPNNGLTHSDPVAAATVEFVRQCPVVYMVDHNCDDGCDLCECSGSDQGTCKINPVTQNPVCRCAEGFEGEACEECSPHHFGKTCQKCQSCDQGTCNAGKEGDGKCHCSRLYSGEKCDKLALGVIFALVITGVFFIGACVYGYKQWKARNDNEEEIVNEDEATPFLQKKKPDVALEDVGVGGIGVTDTGDSINAAPVDAEAE
eukprot:TRINITY_DN13244_c1_g1_i1.p1 TRINITY_DN13244_c1_g1~~TRINITY_DN13244_c1_g1_i1.p1  ORF type:complete len:816 (+),score=148.59 TRINITY_DN13244_c1_g1_i1:49-2496(+)